MSIIPLQLARVSNALQMNLSQRTITQTQRSLLDVQNQLSTGRRLTTPSDDPGDAAISMQIRKLLEQRVGFEDNLKQASSHLSEVDTTLGDMSDLLRQAQTLASANVGSDVSADQRAAAAARRRSSPINPACASSAQVQSCKIDSTNRPSCPSWSMATKFSARFRAGFRARPISRLFSPPARAWPIFAAQL